LFALVLSVVRDNALPHFSYIMTWSVTKIFVMFLYQPELDLDPAKHFILRMKDLYFPQSEKST